jgi:hypothetical protein
MDGSSSEQNRALNVPDLPAAVKQPSDGKLVAGRVRTAVRQVPGQLRKLPAQAEKTVGDAVRLLSLIVEHFRLPLLLALLAPVLPALVLLLAAVARGGSDVPFAVVLVVVGLTPTAWLAVRRSQLLNALQPPAEAAAEMYAAVRSVDVWTQVKSNLGHLAYRPQKLRVRSLGRTMWRGIKFGFDLRNSVADSPRFAPFVPSRLRGVAYLVGWCLISCVVLSLVAAAKLLATSVGVG